MTLAKSSRMFEPATQGGAEESRSTVLPAGENRSVAIPPYAQNPKYRRWYNELCAQARGRDIPTCYTEVHHIQPRSLGGSDDESNLVRLTYREHYLAHWLLTKFHTGPALHKMLKALGAMGMNANGERTAAGWQVELAKRTVRDLELEDSAQAAWYKRREQKQQAERQVGRVAAEQFERDWQQDKFDEFLRFEDKFSSDDLKLLGWENNPDFIARREAVRANPKLLLKRKIQIGKTYTFKI